MKFDERANLNSTTAQPPTLISVTGDVRNSLRETLHRLEQVAAALFGPEPRPVEEKMPPEPQPSIGLNLQRASDALGEIHQVLTRIETRLGP